MKSRTIALIAWIVVSGTSGAQGPPIGTPVFASGTEFVQVPVIVQRGGKHVSGLTKESFVLRQDGKDQPIASFEEMTRAGTPVAPELPQPEPSQVTSRAQQIAVIALDLVNTPNLDRAYFGEQFQR